ncbi:hypothetical protein HALLA_08160 [Halostagnicola larsenii XH-48]|uniref:Uncharacterized protein n=1 Tax=Halostagnicola larsenii XH-48 TaxID=797299 RepID=W0JJD9_9EURY|nr:hypothetical protein [Halostagnicola larsenii]AHF98840.1 hypothetical protein HALLA_08160 [Halostagnicola larsenii XH-48]
MLDELTSACEHCDQPLEDDRLMLSMRTDEGTRRAYECDCGAVTITVVGDAEIDGRSATR